MSGMLKPDGIMAIMPRRFRKDGGGKDDGDQPRFPESLLAEARAVPNGWVYEIDSAYDPNGRVPPEGIKGAWKIGGDGLPTGEHWLNPEFRPTA